MADKKYIYIVEGNTDEDRLKKLGVKYIVKTGGKFIRPEIFSFLNELHKIREIILVTDPDGPGRQIAENIEKRIGKCIVVHADKKKAIYHEKVGIAEMKLDDIASLLKDYLSHDEKIEENFISQDDFIDLNLTGPDGKRRRMALIQKYHMPFTSAKNVLEALNMLCLTKEDVKKELAE